MRPLATFALVVSLALALGACGSDDSTTTASAPEPQAEESAAEDAEKPAEKKPAKKEKAPATGTEMVVADSQFGPILFDADQRAIYLFDKETSSTSECYGECAAAWPPVLTDGEPQAGEGTDAKLLGTTKRDDGSIQVTYDGQPLYYYVDDPPGQVLCHNVDEFGGLWLVVEPSGQAVQ